MIINSNKEPTLSRTHSQKARLRHWQIHSGWEPSLVRTFRSTPALFPRALHPAIPEGDTTERGCSHSLFRLHLHYKIHETYTYHCFRSKFESIFYSTLAKDMTHCWIMNDRGRWNYNHWNASMLSSQMESSSLAALLASSYSSSVCSLLLSSILTFNSRSKSSSIMESKVTPK